MSVPVTMTQTGRQMTVSVAASSHGPAAMHGEVWICSVSKDWNGNAGSWTVPLENISREGVDAAVVYVQDGSRDKPGAMLGAAYTSLH
jgi:hypothetical protein